jgi:hypothetical protein
VVINDDIGLAALHIVENVIMDSPGFRAHATTEEAGEI